MFLKVNKEEVAQQKEGGANYINESGIYPLTIKHAAVSTSKGGSTEVSFNFEDENGNTFTVYGLRLTNNNGEPIFGMDILKSLAVIAGLDEIHNPVEREVKIGKDGKETKTLNILEDFDDVNVLVRLQKEYSKWNGEVKERFVIKKFFSPEGLSGAEIAAGKTEGTQYEKELKYAKQDKLNKVTQEEVDAYLASKSSGGSSKSAAETTTAPKANPFAKKD